MLPELFRAGPVPIHTYGVFVALGILAGGALSEFLHRRDGGRPGAVADLAFVVVLAGLAGARFLFILVNLGYYVSHPAEVFMIWKGGLVFYGGLAGAAVAFVFATRSQGLRLLRTADTVMPGLVLGHALGRLGCFAAGCCYGAPTHLPWAVVFSDPRCLVDEKLLGMRLHPVQLYEALFLFLLCGVLLLVLPRKRFDGQVLSLYGLSYGVFRFLVEFLRADSRGALGPLSTGQWMSLAVVGAAAAGYLVLRNHRS